MNSNERALSSGTITMKLSVEVVGRSVFLLPYAAHAQASLYMLPSSILVIYIILAQEKNVGWTRTHVSSKLALVGQN